METPATETDELQPVSRSLSVQRTARYYTLGSLTPRTREMWIVCHGYGQLASYFIRHFAPVAGEHRYIVAPEALSRFYLTNKFDRVGASWMTREDRQSEINDQTSYLAKLFALLMRQASGVGAEALTQITVLGFSQGVPTIWRWLERDQPPIHNLVVWAGSLPEEAGRWQRLSECRLFTVVGEEDPYLNRQRVESMHNVLRVAQIPFRHFGFEGGHVIDEGALLQLAREIETAPVNS